MQKYLESSHYINYSAPQVFDQAKQLASGQKDKEHIAKACFEFVRDQIKHSWDYKLNPVTAIASDVLKHGTGYCYAKSHLLAALLRANDIPAGLCYQRLTIENNAPPFCLHGLNAVFLEKYGWYRIDARGNKDIVKADFCPPIEKLAFPIINEGEADLPEIWAEPLTIVVKALESRKTYIELGNNLPDIDLIKTIDIFPDKKHT
ncbi:MAG: transglutaminase family protein [Methylococcales bacterium]|nr:transglutaminase family protein [Methylococcales bacterium]